MNANDRAVLQRAHAVMNKRNLPIGMTMCMPRTCAVSGLLYAALYHEKNGFWLFSECVRVTHEGAGQSSGIRVPWDSIYGAEKEICPWCHSGAKKISDSFSSTIHCPKCSQDVCVGRTSGDMFHCCDACGGGGIVSGSIDSSVAFTMGGSMLQGAQQSRIGKAAAPRLMLTSGKR
jgi:hypothetical protein